MSEYNGARPTPPDEPTTEVFRRLSRIFHEQDGKGLMETYTREELEALSYIAVERVEKGLNAFMRRNFEFELQDVLVACYGDAFQAGRSYEREMSA